MLKFAKFIGANTDFATAQAYLFPRSYEHDLQNPVFGLVISCEGEDIFIKLRQKILSLEDQFASPFERVSDKLHELSGILISSLNGIGVENLKFSLFCAKENVFYILQLGNNIVEILRDGERIPIIKESADGDKVVSGFIRPGDKILVLSAKPGELDWSGEAVKEVFNMPPESIDDAELIFVSDELKDQNQDDLSGVKNIEPVALILIENTSLDKSTDSTNSGGSNFTNFSKPKLILKLPDIKLFLFLRIIFRRLLGFLRQGSDRIFLLNRKILLALIILILVCASAGGGFLYYQNKQSAKAIRLNNLLVSVSNHIGKAQELKDSDKKTAADEINQAKTQLTEAMGLDGKNPKVEEIKRELEEKENEVLKIYRNFELELFLSLDLIKTNFQAQRLSFSVNKLLLLDTNEKSLVSINTSLKTPEILAGSQQLGEASLASINGSNAFVYSKDKGLIHIDLDLGKSSVVSKPDEGWGRIEDIFGFSDNLYVLDLGNPPSGGMIWKYAPTVSGFSQKQAYLRGEADLSQAKKMVIDYSVWVLTGEPDILKFTAGRSDFYGISGIDKPLTQIDGLYVTEDLDSVFILDKLNNRILVTKKNGEYLAQYIKEELGKVDDFFVDEGGKAIYLLMENKIFKTPLR